MMVELTKYLDDIDSGAIPAGLHLRNVVTRFREDLQNPAWIYDETRVQKVVDFIKRLKHFTDKHANKPFILQPWQLFIVANL